MKWEYRALSVWRSEDGYLNSCITEEDLNALGAEGWEMVTGSWDARETELLGAVFKRQVEVTDG